MLFPERGPLPQISQTCAMRCSRGFPVCGAKLLLYLRPASPANHRGHDGQFIRGLDKDGSTTLTNCRAAILFPAPTGCRAQAEPIRSTPPPAKARCSRADRTFRMWSWLHILAGVCLTLSDILCGSPYEVVVELSAWSQAL